VDHGELSPEARTIIAEAVNPVLRRNSIQYGYHVVEETNRGISRIVLECVPLERVQKSIRDALAEAIERIPTKPGRRNTLTGIRMLSDQDAREE